MSDFRSHLPVQTHQDGATFTASSDYGLAIGGYESAGGDFLVACIDINRNLCTKDSNVALVTKAEDSVHATGDSGVYVLNVREDVLAASTDADGDYQSFKSDSLGRTWVRGASDYAEDSAFADLDLGTHNLSVRQDTLAASTSLDGDYASFKSDSLGRIYTRDASVYAEDSVHTTGDLGSFMLGVRNDAGTALAADGDYIPLSMDADGSVRVTVTSEAGAGTKVCEYNTSAALAAAAVANHDYTVTALKTLIANRIWASASGAIKIEVIVDPAGTPATQWVGFNSTAHPNINVPIEEFCSVAAGIVIRIAITNLDNKAQDVYSTLTGRES